MVITSLTNKKIKNLVNLLQKSKSRKEQDVFLVEGSKMFLEAKEDKVQEVYVRESFWEKEEENGLVKKKLEKTGYELVSDEVFKKISDTITPQGIVAVLKQYHYNPEQFLKKEKPTQSPLPAIT